MARGTLIAFLAFAGLVASAQSRTDITGVIRDDRQLPKIALPDFRGTGDAQAWMGAFNSTLLSELSGSGALKVVEKNLYPVAVPQQPSDFRRPSAASSGGGLWFTDWSNPPANATHLAFGYAAVQADQLVVRGWL